MRKSSLTACLILFMMISPPAKYERASGDLYVVWVVPGLARGDCVGYPVFFDHEPGALEANAAVMFPKTYNVLRKIYKTVNNMLESVSAQDNN